MIKGLSEKNYKIIKDIISRYDAEFYAYGSRVKGDYTDLSDLDILVKAENFDEIHSVLCNEFDKSLLPFVVNLTNYYGIDKKFYNLIEKDLVKI